MGREASQTLVIYAVPTICTGHKFVYTRWSTAQDFVGFGATVVTAGEFAARVKNAQDVSATSSLLPFRRRTSRPSERLDYEKLRTSLKA